MTRLFGTDGVRGLANGEVINADLALRLSEAAAFVFGRTVTGSGRMTAVVGRDPRASGEFLSAAVVAGLASSGVDVYDVGVLPTPAVAFLTKDWGANFGVVLSASHNPMPDNGIKFFAKGGLKLPDSVEDRIEAAMKTPADRPVGADVGRVRQRTDGAQRYVDHLMEILPHRLDGLSIVLDTANGASSGIAQEAFTRAGATVRLVGNEPDGLNINDGVGSTHLDNLARAVTHFGSDFGLAFDGDADRCLAVDHDGNVVDGDQIMAVLALDFKERGELRGDTLVATSMSNLGLHKAMKTNGIRVERTDVGDRYVLERMREGGFSLGGEQSGHVIALDYGTTGDGMQTGLLLSARVAATGTSLAQLAAVMTRLPQVMINVKGVDKFKVDANEPVQDAVKSAENDLGEDGRVLLRKSGTEPLVRVMVEAQTHERANDIAEGLAAVVKRNLTL